MGRVVNAPHGIWGSVLLPVNRSGSIDWQALAEEVDTLCATDLAGIYTNGTAAEFFNQTDAEYERITDIVAQAATKSGMAFQIGVSSTNPRVARARLAQARAYKPAAVQFTLPDWWPPSSAEIERFVDGMQDAAGDTPLVIYNPPHAKVQLTLPQIASLRKIAPGMVGAKLAGGDASWHVECQKLPAGFAVFVPGHKVAFSRPLGASGSYSNVACFSPNGAVRHWDLIETDPDLACDIEARFNQFLQRHIFPVAKRAALSDPALDKMLAAVGGWGPVGARLLWPYSSASPDDVTGAAKAARQDLPELF